MVAHCADLSREFRISRDNEPTFPRGDLLVGIEGEHGSIAEASHLAAVIHRADRLARILDHSKAMASGNLEDRLHLCRTAKSMDDQDSTGARCDRRLDAFRIEIE